MRIMNSLGDIPEEDSDKHNFWLKCFTDDAYDHHTTSVAIIQVNEYYITKEDINTGLNTTANFVFPYNAMLKYWSYVLGGTRNPEGMCGKSTRKLRHTFGN